MASILSCFAVGSVPSLSARWFHRTILSAWIYWARIESALVLSALQRMMTVSKAGKRLPHSIRLMVLAVQPTNSASCSWVSLRCFRMRWIFRPPALKSNAHHPCLSSKYMLIMPTCAHLYNFPMSISWCNANSDVKISWGIGWRQWCSMSLKTFLLSMGCDNLGARSNWAGPWIPLQCIWGPDGYQIFYKKAPWNIFNLRKMTVKIGLYQRFERISLCLLWG